MQALFYMDMQQDDPAEMLDRYCICFPVSKQAYPFFTELVQGVYDKRAEIDPIIERHSDNWKIGRMPCVDRNVMRIAVYEMIYREDIPPKVSINEAIDIGKKYGAEDSGAFINGILDAIRIAVEQGGRVGFEPAEKSESHLHFKGVEHGPEKSDSFGR